MHSPPPSRTTVLIVDDHAVLRSGLRLLIDAHADMTVVGEAGSLMDALDVATRVTPRVITLDLSMPGPSGVSAIEKLRRISPESRIIVLTMHDDPAYVRSSIALGAAGYVNKSAADTELIAAIRAVAHGRIFIDSTNRAAVDAPFSTASLGVEAPAHSLSEREREVLRQVARGFTNQQIADEIGISVKTIESYRARLMKKLGLRERSDLVRVAIEMGLL